MSLLIIIEWEQMPQLMKCKTLDEAELKKRTSVLSIKLRKKNHLKNNILQEQLQKLLNRSNYNKNYYEERNTRLSVMQRFKASLKNPKQKEELPSTCKATQTFTILQKCEQMNQWQESLPCTILSYIILSRSFMVVYLTRMIVN